MKRFLILAMVSVAGAAQASTLFYAGDFNGVNGLRSEQDGSISSQVYEGFNLAQASTVTDVFGDFLDANNGAATANAYWEIRSGNIYGTGGTLVASGTGTATSSQTSGSGFGVNIWRYDVATGGVNLAAGGLYWVTVALDLTNLNSFNFVATTSGANGVGGPIGAGNSAWNSSTYGETWGNGTDGVGGNTADFEFGVNGNPVPEPASFAVLGIGALALIKRRRK